MHDRFGHEFEDFLAVFKLPLTFLRHLHSLGAKAFTNVAEVVLPSDADTREMSQSLISELRSIMSL
jgi:hypothetical protein